MRFAPNFVAMVTTFIKRKFALEMKRLADGIHAVGD